MPSKQHPPFIRVNGRTYRLASKVTDTVVKDSISKAADKAALQNIVDNLVSHSNDIARIAPDIMATLDSKAKADKVISNLSAHCDVLQKFLRQVLPTFNRYHGKGYEKKEKAPQE